MTNIIIQSTIQPLSHSISDVYSGLIASKHSKTTQDTYKQGLKHFTNYLLTGKVVKGKRGYLAEIQVKTVLMEYLTFDAKTANSYLGAYQSAMVKAGYTPNSINVRVASVKAFVRYAFDYEQCNYQLDKVKSLTPEVYRDTRGTTPDNIKEVLALPDTLTVKGKRDYAILRLLWDCALRRGEVSNLNVSDFNYSERTLKIKGKGRLNKEIIYLSAQSAEAINDWLGCRGLSDKLTDKKSNVTGNQADSLTDTPLFISLDNATRGHRLSTKSVYRVAKEYSGEVIARQLSPHQFRHSAITAVLDATGGNVRMAQKLSRHKNLDVLTRYDDNRVALQKEAVNLLANLV